MSELYKAEQKLKAFREAEEFIHRIHLTMGAMLVSEKFDLTGLESIKVTTYGDAITLSCMRKQLGSFEFTYNPPYGQLPTLEKEMSKFKGIETAALVGDGSNTSGLPPGGVLEPVGQLEALKVGEGLTTTDSLINKG